MILIGCTAVFLVQTVVQLSYGETGEKFLLGYLGLVPYAVLHGYIWQLASYIFLHGGLFHILINMFVLWMFGGDVERAWGTRRFYFYFFLCGIGAGAINVAVKASLYAMNRPEMTIPTIGASGAIYGVLLAAAVLFPDRQVWLIPFPVSLPMRAYVAIMAAIEFFGTLGASGDNISHVCHLGGMLVGYLYLRRGSYMFGFRNRYSDWKRRRLKRKFEVYAREHRDKPPTHPGDWVN